jgi:hypothetical protein
MVKRAKLDPNPRTIDFTTQNPAVSSEMGWLTIDQQIQALTPSRAVATRRLDGVGVDIRTENVARLSLRALPSACRVSLDGQILSLDSGGDAVFDRRGARWELGNSRKTGEKSPLRSGPFKQVFARRFMFVVGTTGTPEENLWSEEAARFQAETMLYRGNGAVDIVRDKDYSSSRFRGRNVVIFGNSDTNSAWKSLLGASPVQFKRGAAIVGKKSFSSDNLSGLLVAPNPHDSDGLVAAVTGTGLAGFKRTDRLPIFSSGVAYPDWIVMSPNSPGGILADGFFGNDWTLEHGESAFAPQ